jgi:uncharacterized membrane protein
MDVWVLVRFLHLVALAFFVGGQLMLAAVVAPAARRDGDDAAIRAVARRFGVGSLAAIAVLLATGAAMASHFGRWDDPVLQLKLALVGVIGVLIGLHVATPARRAASVAIFLVSLAVVWLGVELAH